MIRLIEKDGWQCIKQAGSHRIYRHSVKSGIVIIPDHGSKNSKSELKCQSGSWQEFNLYSKRSSK